MRSRASPAHSKGRLRTGGDNEERSVVVGGIVVGAEDEVLNAVATALEPFRKGGAPITVDTDISQDLNLDSVAVLDLLMELEEKFDVSIPLNLVPEIRTVGELAETVRKLREG